MARFYAQICTVAFLIVTIGGFFVGNAVTVAHGQAVGNVDGMQLHLTYVRDILDLILLAAFAYVGFMANRRIGRIVLAILAALGTVEDEGPTSIIRPASS